MAVRLGTGTDSECIEMGPCSVLGEDHGSF